MRGRNRTAVRGDRASELQPGPDVVRRAVAGDVPALRLLWADLADESSAWSPFPCRLFDPAFVEDGIALVATRRRTITGTVYANAQPEHFGHVFGLYVVPAARGRNIASTLMRAVAEEVRAEGHFRLVLSVESTNVAALTFYARLGFTETARTLVSTIAGPEW